MTSPLKRFDLQNVSQIARISRSFQGKRNDQSHLVGIDYFSVTLARKKNQHRGVLFFFLKMAGRKTIAFIWNLPMHVTLKVMEDCKIILCNYFKKEQLTSQLGLS